MTSEAQHQTWGRAGRQRASSGARWWRSPSIAFSLLVELGDIWMMRKMLLNVRERATTATPRPGLDAAEGASCGPLP